MSQTDLYESIGELRGIMSGVQKDVAEVKESVKEIQTNCAQQQCKVGNVIGKGVTGTSVVGLIVAAILTWLQQKGLM